MYFLLNMGDIPAILVYQRVVYQSTTGSKPVNLCHEAVAAELPVHEARNPSAFVMVPILGRAGVI